MATAMTLVTLYIHPAATRHTQNRAAVKHVQSFAMKLLERAVFMAIKVPHGMTS